MKPEVLEESSLTDPVERGVRLVALSLIGAVQKAGEELTKCAKELRDGDSAADDALHDFRVAMRRLRSWTRVFKPWLDSDISKKQRRRLSTIADGTRVSRDAAVHLEWLQEQRGLLSARQRLGQAWLSERLSEKRRAGAADALGAVDEFAALAPKLTKGVGYYRAPLSDKDAGESFGSTIAERIREEAERLRRRLSRVDRFTEVEQAHRARIAAKNLRYLIEPVVAFSSGGEEVIDSLKKLQDSLGNLHDVHMFANELAAATESAAAARARRVSEMVMTEEEGESENDRIRRALARDPGPGLLRLARLLHDQGMEAYAQIERDWLNDGGLEFFDRVYEFAAEIGDKAAREAEIERKFLLRQLPAIATEAPSVEIEQGYLPGDKIVERIRRMRFADTGEKWLRTVKSGNAVKRVELEEEVDATLARALWRLATDRLRKRRYSIREADEFTWEIDEFLDRNLVLAEIELPRADTNFEIPAWLVEVLDREVTDDPEYSNERLARSAGVRAPRSASAPVDSVSASVGRFDSGHRPAPEDSSLS